MYENATIHYLYTATRHGHGSGASESVFQQVWQAIVSAEMPPGTSVTEEYLAGKFDVSRTPMREAIQRLVGIGLIRRARGRSMRIAELNVETMLDLTTTRERLEGLVAWHVWDRARRAEITLESLQILHGRHKNLAATGDADLMLAMGLEFHRHLRSLSGNEVAVTMLERLLLALEPYRRLAKSHIDRCDQIIAEHSEVLELLVGHDGDAVETAMRKHIAEAREFYRARLEERNP